MNGYGLILDPEERYRRLLALIANNRTPEVRTVLQALWNVHQIDAVRAEPDAEPQMVRMRDAGHAVLLGCIALVDGIEEEIKRHEAAGEERVTNV